MQFSVKKMKEVFKSETDKRVSEKSAELLDEELQEYGAEIVEDAVAIAKENDRITVRESDVKQAIRQRNKKA